MYGIEYVMSGGQKISVDQSGKSFMGKDEHESRKKFER